MERRNDLLMTRRSIKTSLDIQLGPNSSQSHDN